MLTEFYTHKTSDDIIAISCSLHIDFPSGSYTLPRKHTIQKIPLCKPAYHGDEKNTNELIGYESAETYVIN